MDLTCYGSATHLRSRWPLIPPCGVVGIQCIISVWIVHVELVWGDSDYGTVELVHLSHVVCKQPMAFDDVVVKLVPFGRRRNLWSWKFSERMEEEAIDDQDNVV